MAITTAVCTSFKQEMLQATHNFAAPISITASGVSAAFTLTGMSSTANVEVGMAATGTNVAAGAVVASIDSASQVTLSKAHTGTITTQSITFTADVFKMALIKVGAGSYSGTQTNIGTPGTGTVSVTNLGTDEHAASGGYSAGGTTLTNVTPTVSGSTALTDFTPDPSYTSATISTIGGIIYNNSVHQGHANGITANASGSAIGRTVSVHDFGGTQTVTSGTITFVFPTADASNAILRVA
jgi:hypothetical protein